MRLRNTEWVIGVVVYTGENTKMAKNQRSPPSKMSSLDRRMNRTVIVAMVYVLIILVGLTIPATLFEMHSKSAWYLGTAFNPRSAFLTAIIRFGSYFVLVSFVIPQSMMVTLDICKV